MSAESDILEKVIRKMVTTAAAEVEQEKSEVQKSKRNPGAYSVPMLVLGNEYYLGDRFVAAAKNFMENSEPGDFAMFPAEHNHRYASIYQAIHYKGKVEGIKVQQRDGFVFIVNDNDGNAALRLRGTNLRVRGGRTVSLA